MVDFSKGADKLMQHARIVEKFEKTEEIVTFKEFAYQQVGAFFVRMANARIGEYCQKTGVKFPDFVLKGAEQFQKGFDLLIAHVRWGEETVVDGIDFRSDPALAQRLQWEAVAQIAAHHLFDEDRNNFV